MSASANNRWRNSTITVSIIIIYAQFIPRAFPITSASRDRRRWKSMRQSLNSFVTVGWSCYTSFSWLTFDSDVETISARIRPVIKTTVSRSVVVCDDVVNKNPDECFVRNRNEISLTSVPEPSSGSVIATTWLPLKLNVLAAATNCTWELEHFYKSLSYWWINIIFSLHRWNHEMFSCVLPFKRQMTRLAVCIKN